MLDLDHPMAEHIFSASGLVDALMLTAQRMTVSPTKERLLLLADCHTALGKLPPLNYEMVSFLKDLPARLARDHSMVILCRMGIGRAALVAAAILVLCGFDPHDALAAICHARGCQVPDTKEQEQWVARFAKTHQTLKPSDDLWMEVEPNQSSTG